MYENLEEVLAKCTKEELESFHKYVRIELCVTKKLLLAVEQERRKRQKEEAKAPERR